MKKIDIFSRCNLSKDDINSLFLLYLPLASNDSISLYMLLNSLLERSNFKCEGISTNDILDMLSLTYKKYDEAKAKLEALNLIKVYENDEKQIIFLQSPASPKTFINETNLGLYLASKVGEDAYLNLVNKFMIPTVNLEGFSNVTRTVDEVFSSVITTSFNDVDFNLVGKKVNQGANYSDNVFDFEMFLASINKEFICENINTDFKRKITSIVCTYGFQLEQVVNLYNESINKRGEFDFATFKRKAQKIGSENLGQNIKLTPKNSENKIVSRFENITAQELLIQLMGPDYNNLYLNRIITIYDKLDYEVGVINVLITYVYRTTKDIPTFSYFTKVADTWREKGINNTEDAINFMSTGKYPVDNLMVKGNKRKESQATNLNDWQKEALEKLKRGETI